MKITSMTESNNRIHTYQKLEKLSLVWTMEHTVIANIVTVFQFYFGSM